MTKTNHKENGDFAENNEYALDEGNEYSFGENNEHQFDSTEGKKQADEHSWSNKREELLKRFGKWDEAKDTNDD